MSKSFRSVSALILLGLFLSLAAKANSAYPKWSMTVLGGQSYTNTKSQQIAALTDQMAQEGSPSEFIEYITAVLEEEWSGKNDNSGLLFGTNITANISQAFAVELGYQHFPTTHLYDADNFPSKTQIASWHFALKRSQPMTKNSAWFFTIGPGYTRVKLTGKDNDDDDDDGNVFSFSAKDSAWNLYASIGAEYQWSKNWQSTIQCTFNRASVKLVPEKGDYMDLHIKPITFTFGLSYLF